MMSTKSPDHCSTPLLNNGTVKAGRFAFLVPNHLVHLPAMTSGQAGEHRATHHMQWNGKVCVSACAS